MSDDRVVIPSLPSPRERFDRDNEAAFRSSVEKTLEEVADQLRKLAERVKLLEEA